MTALVLAKVMKYILLEEAEVVLIMRPPIEPESMVVGMEDIKELV